MILWRRSDNLVFSLLLGGSTLVNIGDGVECVVRGILQVVDETEGPSTKREYQLTSVPVGRGLIGHVVDFLGRPLSIDSSSTSSTVVQENSPSIPLGTDAYLPLLNAQPDMESREQIAEPLVTGVKALDVLTPLGRGQALQVSGNQGSGKTQLCIDAVIGQAGGGVRCVYAAVGCSPDQLAGTVAQLRAHGCMDYTTVVAATADRALGEQYAAMLTACSIAEAVRDEGGHALVVLNDVSVMVRMWEMITVAMADLGPVATEVQAAEVAELAEAAQDAAAEAGVLDVANSEKKQQQQQQEDDDEEEEEEMVEYEGMLVSVAAAQRRRFFSSLVQRCAKMHRRLRGGSLSALLVVPGSPATGNIRKAKEKILKYHHLSEEQKEKLLRALEAQESTSTTTGGGGEQKKPKGGPKGPVPEELRTEVVEEFMSIADGQIVLRNQRDPVTGGVSVDPQLSVSRIGSRAYPPALSELAPQVRFELAQAEDAKKFAADAGAGGAGQKALQRAAVIAAALPQPQRTVCPLEIQVVHLLALKTGLLDDVPVDQVYGRLRGLTERVEARGGGALQEVRTTQRLTAAAESEILRALVSDSDMSSSTSEKQPVSRPTTLSS